MADFREAQDIKVGVIGYGGAFNMGAQHLKLMEQAGMTPAAVADVDEERLEVAREDFPGIETHPSAEAMLDAAAVDLVALVTPHNTHAELAVQCLEAGRSVVVEKPMALTTAECDRMIAAAERSGALLSVFHNRHWDGCILRAVEQVRDRGLIGEVFRIEAHMGGYHAPSEWWRNSRSISGGILYDWGVHLLEYSLQLLDGDLVEVSGFSHTGFWQEQSPWGADTNEDEAFAVARFDNGKWLTLSMSSVDSFPKNADRNMVEVTGTRGTYMFGGGSYRSVVQTDGEAVEQEGGNPRGERERYYANVAAALLGEEELIITPEWARRPIHIIDLAVRSADAGHALQARYP